MRVFTRRLRILYATEARNLDPTEMAQEIAKKSCCVLCDKPFTSAWSICEIRGSKGTMLLDGYCYGAYGEGPVEQLRR